MTKEIKEVNAPEEVSEEEPIVYAIKKDLKGWKFSRRDFLKGAVTTAEMAAVAGVIAGCGGSAIEEAAVVDTPAVTSVPATAPPPTNTPTPVPTDTATPVPTDTATPVPTDTATPVPTDTATSVPTDTATPVPTNTPTQTPTKTPTPQPVAVIDTDRLNIRLGPGINYDILGVAENGAEFLITGRLADESWYQIDYERQVGWVSADFIIVQNADQVPIISDIPPTNTPAATATPTEAPIPEPTPTLPGVKGTVCTCDRVCTCDAVCTCQGHGHYWHPN